MTALGSGQFGACGHGILNCKATAHKNATEKCEQEPRSMRKKLRGGCSCGKVRYQLLAVPIRVHCCHCTDCQRHTGSAFVINAIFETSAIRIMRGALEAVPVRRSYGPHDIYRCRKCKVPVWRDY